MFDTEDIDRFSSKNMLEYLRDFDYLKEKYLIDDASLLKKLEAFERYEQQGQLQKMPPSYIGKTVNSVYGLTYNKRINTIQNFSIVWQKVINNFLNIKGLELLFNEHYYDFEWDMHLELDFEKSSSTYYRDHMEHQIRNMYMMMVLLDKYGFLKTIKNILLDKTNSKVSDYVKNRYSDFIEKSTFSDSRREVLLDCAKYYFFNQVKDFIDNDETYKASFAENNKEKLVYQLISFFENENFIEFNYEVRVSFFEFFSIKINSDGEISFSDDEVSFSIEKLKVWIESISEEVLINSYVKTYTIYYIVRSSAMISALFHDISYPVCFFFNIRRRVGQYLPAMNAFTHNVEADIDRIVSLLQPSLLFVLVSESEIRAKLSKNQKKYDHGVFSAIALLLSFYESGRIHQLSIDKQIAIELAALAIYNHNFSYYINDTGKKEYYRPVFQQNPISYLLKICDDMQEWDRRYFELSEKNSFTYCPVCLSPIIKIKEYDDKNEIRENLLCGCKGKKYAGAQFFPSRNMYIVTTCEEIDINSNKKDSFSDLIFSLNYNLLDLLYMSQISTSYSVYRSKELGKLKTLLLNQRYYDERNSKDKIDNIYLEYTMSNNPIFLKSKIILFYLLKVCEFSSNDICKNIDKIKTTVFEDFYNYVNELKNSLLTINFACIDSNQFYETFELETHEVLKKYVQNEQEFNEKQLFLLWFHSLLYDIDSSQNGILWDLFCETFNREYACVDSKSYFDSVKKSTWDKYLDSFKTKIQETCSEILIRNILNDVSDELLFTEEQEKQRTNLIKSLKRKTCFYLELAKYIMKSMYDVSLLPQEKDFVGAMFSLEFTPYEDKNSEFYDLINDLLNDVYRIISNQVNLYDDFDVSKYKTQYLPQKKMSHVVEKYCNAINWYGYNSESYINFVLSNLDYHSDLIIFEVLGNKIKSE